MLLAVINGEQIAPVPTGFIIDSPWLPNWAGYSIMDYFIQNSGQAIIFLHVFFDKSELILINLS